MGRVWVVYVYRGRHLPTWQAGSQAVTPAFLDDLSETLDPVYIAGDLNVRPDRSDDANRQLRQLLEVYGFANPRTPVAAHSMSSRHDAIQRRHMSPCTTLVCPTTICFSGQCL